ncbi:hypothetical protein FACS1894189_3640 [Planctomycetales bacterium]|nr:hypothetical protein FACS1894189_3640 [Planctomycetales bacterium]
MIAHGWTGYGLFWAIIERLADSTDYCHARDYSMLAYNLRTESQLIKSIVEDFQLFEFTEDGLCFYSESLMERMRMKDVCSSKRSEAKRKYWSDKKARKNAVVQKSDTVVQKSDTVVQQDLYNCTKSGYNCTQDSAINKESKVNKIKERKETKEKKEIFDCLETSELSELPDDLLKAIQTFFDSRAASGEPVDSIRRGVLIQKLLELSPDNAERKRLALLAVERGWRAFYLDNQKPPPKPPPERKSTLWRATPRAENRESTDTEITTDF